MLAQTAEPDDATLKAIHKGLGPALYNHLLSADREIAALVQAVSPSDYAMQGGVNILLKMLEQARFAESKLRGVP